jgi:hypothetical protein
MKTRKNLVTLVAVGLLVFAFTAVYANENLENVDWDAFSENLVVGLKSDNLGVRTSAMQQVIRYADNVNVDDAIFDIVEMYRSSNDEKVRQLALAAMHKTENAWAMDFLKRNLKFEKSEKLRTAIYHILNDYEPGTVVAKSAAEQNVEYVLVQK